MRAWSFTARALRDFNSIVKHLDEQAVSQLAVAKLMDEMIDALDNLGRFPLSGTERPEFRRNARMILVQSYIIFYRPVEHGHVEILHIRHQHRKPLGRRE